jgi:hypothetical protein
VDLNGKDPLVDLSADWVRSASTGRSRTAERQRVRRRTRKGSVVRAKIRLRIWLACTGALLVMALVIYLALGSQHAGEAGFQLGPKPAIAGASAASRADVAS